MKALVKTKREKGIWLENVDLPSYGDGEVLIQLHQTAICGTDIHIYSWDEWAQATIQTPLIIGHEFVGKVAAVGRGVTHLAVGDRVSGEGHLVCGRCRNCRGERQHLCPFTKGIGVNRHGAFAEYLVMPETNVMKLPEAITDDAASILDPFGNAVHTALSFDLFGKDVLITGAGPVGIMACAVARHAGARLVVITDVNDYRLDLARQMGATQTVNVSQQSLAEVMQSLNMDGGFDVGLEMSGHPAALNTLLKSMYHGGQVAILGIPPAHTQIDWNDVIFKGLMIKGIYGREMYTTWHQMFAMLQSGFSLAPVITHHYPIAQYQEAFEVMASGQSGKVILQWD